MKIAILAPITWRTPPRRYGPWEQVASVLCETLVEQGEEVTLFATGDSVTAAALNYVCDAPLAEKPKDAKVWECLHISNLMETAASFDLIHNHYDFLPLSYSKLISTPLLTTIHGFSSPDILPVYQKYNAAGYYVSISNSDRHSSLQYLDTVYNGIDERQFSFEETPGNYLLYFGRIHPHKGAHDAIEIARQTGLKLLICGLVQDEHYFEMRIKPHLDQHNIVYRGNVGPEERNYLLGHAMALLHPISFDEPFGLSVAEALMCGTPVIAFNRGSMKELIKHGKTGFLVTNNKEAIAAIGKLSHINRYNCHRTALAQFSRHSMATHYRKLYQQILSERRQT
ncbi:glycosyltransferase family 4 protein [Deminuibacter soli]|uniref:Glycosyltransferase family 4 protein n=1 Tax=Deminuibacter soli TaxID=2291815 RepID=A0A3E1NP12_9BACT|nr:glycosyltransferase family 4 protein [Deminuibacter soli]RFM29564.1 glycosyltransferase family 4 protein [Deminuibacter soli]